MAPLLRNLLGNATKDRELTDGLRAVLQEMQDERARYEAVLENVRASSIHLQTLGEPIARVETDVESASSRIAELEQRLSAMVQLMPKLETMDERVESLAEGQKRASAQVVDALEQAQGLRTNFEEMGAKIERAEALRERLENFLEVEKPFQQVRDDVGTLRGQLESTNDQLSKFRQQHDRLLDAHKLAITKMEALDRRREELSRDLQDKERRVATVSQSVRGLDGVQTTIDDLKRQIGTLKALGDFVAQKNAALEAQRDSIDGALARTENLDRAMRNVDAGMRQLQANESALGAMQEQVAALQSLHDTVLERSREIGQLQRETDERSRDMRAEIASAQEALQKAVTRFEFEAHGLETVSQRVTDVRAALSEFESRFGGLAESNHTVNALETRTQVVSGQLQALGGEVERIRTEAARLEDVRRGLDEVTQLAMGAMSRVTRIEESQPAIEAALDDLGQLRGAHARVKDALEQTQLAHDELVRAHGEQQSTREWLTTVEQSVAALQSQFTEIQAMGPVVDHAQEQTRQVRHSLETIESRRAFVEELQARLTTLGTLGGQLDERGRQLLARMDAAEQRFEGLSSQSDEAARIGRVVAETSASLEQAVRDADDARRKAAAAESHCGSVEALAERTRTLQRELEQRHQSLQTAKQDLQQASALRQEAADSAQQLDELSKRLAATLREAEARQVQLAALATQLERRSTELQPVEQQLDAFEQRMAKWDLVEQDVARSLEQLVARQGTVDAVQADLERMFTMAEQTAIEVREITSSTREVAESRKQLDSVRNGLEEVRAMSSAIEERKRQLAKAEERLSRADALLVDVQSSLEALQGQKVLVDQAVQKAGSLKSLLRQAEGLVESLREERELVARMRTAVGDLRVVEDDGDEAVAEDEDDEPMARAA
ncbi:MAG: hypothetical protein U0704_14430 [Candidatus Eisenbacteria bacterium]